MLRISVCLECKNEFKYDLYRRKIGKFCSKLCDIKYKTFWENASFQQKLLRISKYFDKYVDKKDGCWGWKGSLLDGRGRLYFEKKAIQAHRISWMIHNNSEIPRGMYICHSCDNEICTNPQHLFLGTPSQNIIDMVAKDRKANAKLKTLDILDILKMLKSGIQGKIIAMKYDVKPMTISDIKTGRTWNHITNVLPY